MRKFSTTSFGCKVNQYEQQQIRTFLLESGLNETAFGNSADIIVIHTCCVTHVASSKSRQGIKKALKANKNAKIIISGCLPSAPEKEIASILEIGPDLNIISKEQNLKAELEKLIFNRTDSRTANTAKIKDNIADNDDFGPLSNFSNQTRAFLKIQDGCDGYCTYCIIPKIRKNVCSRDEKSILEEAQNLVKAGHGEIVLTGIFLGAYGKETVRRKKWDNSENLCLAELVDKIAKITGLKRLRLSSLEPKDITDALLNVIGENDNIAPHFHLPLQSGSDEILKKMARQYNVNDFKEVIYKINQKFDRPAVTTDIIVGFPGETEKDFADTEKLSKFANFSKIHVFSFSPRKGTPAADFKPKVKLEIIKERSARLQKLSDILAENYRKQFAGENLEVIIENTEYSKGRCGRYFEVKINNLPADIQKNDMVIAKLNPDTVTAEYFGRIE